MSPFIRSILIAVGVVAIALGLSNDARMLVFAHLGRAESQATLAREYELGHKVERDEFAASRWYRAAAENGHAGAQIMLGQRYGAGRGLPRDDAEALRWFRASAELGHPMGQAELGMAYAAGVLVPRDHQAAQEWLQPAAQAGIADAVLVLRYVEQLLDGTDGDSAH